MTAHDQLLQQLQASVAERRGGGRAARRVSIRVLALAAALVIGAAALAAAQVGVLPGTTHHASTTITYRQAAYNATQEAGRTAACRPLKARTVTTAPAAAAAALLQAGPADAKAQALALRDLHTGPYVAGSARRVVLPHGIAIMYWLSVGQGWTAYADPGACAAERIAQLHRDYPDPGSRLRQKAETHLQTMTDVRPGAQTLWFMEQVPGSNSIGGSGVPLTGTSVRGGLVSAGSNGYVGLTQPAATHVTADGHHGYHRTARVVRRFWALRPPRGTGPIVLRERAADGRVLARRTLRR